MIETAGLASIHVVRMEVPVADGLASPSSRRPSPRPAAPKVRVTTLSVEGGNFSPTETVRHHFS